MTKAQLKEQLERAEKAEGPEDISTLYLSRIMSVLHVSPVTHDRIIQLWRIGAYESAAIALTEAVLPGGFWGVSRTAKYPGMIPGSSDKAFLAECGNWGSPSRAYDNSAALALIAATLKALIAETEE